MLKNILHILHLKKDKKTLLNLDNRDIQRISNPKSKPGLVPPAPAQLPVLAGDWVLCPNWPIVLWSLVSFSPPPPALHSIPTLASDHTFITIYVIGVHSA